MKEDVIRAHAELPALCEHIHLPLQSGSSAILKRMRRTYDRQRYMDRVALIREHVPDCAITTDIIVGFPGETEADFERDAGGRRGGRLRRRLHLRLLAAARNRGGDDGRAGRRTRSRSSGWSGWSSWSSGGPRNAPSASSAASWRSWSKAPAAPTRPGCAGARRHNKAVNFEGTADARRAGRGRDRPPRPRRRSAGSEQSRSAGSAEASSRSSARPASARPGWRSRWRSCCGSGARIRWRSPATRCRSTRGSAMLTGAATPRSRRGWSTGWSGSCR